MSRLCETCEFFVSAYDGAGKNGTALIKQAFLEDFGSFFCLKHVFFTKNIDLPEKKAALRIVLMLLIAH